MASLRQQIKQRRKALGLRQEDMGQRIGMLRQQYQYLEAKGNPRLDTLELVAKGLDSEVMLIPREKLLEVRALLDGEGSGQVGKPTLSNAEDPWAGLLDDDA
ncbi:helix-turn-helix transcriptional regulator [Alloalcanivorax profundimaris]|uniref:Helix-turn-helix domain-containing protein n=1 Tax=Alloalcanivorax profundimaris TaxID=2735259 RepID=A0ABS0ARM7_9GAMM|nr:helix-turn-helix transcriptional regulator [Alloalcanivorax profundimaris]MBF1803695.1 helix-turn-helix transcriptional regulator [Alloalcanivorax profundimaris]MBF5056787.1 helix-turn-helix domain-containing protein [Alloalcanivorax profundimaris]